MPRPAIVVHGGAGIYGDEAVAEAQAGVREAAAAGASELTRGASALCAVLAAVRCLEDDPRFNAGTGSVLTSEGTLENDASVMDGRDLSAGAVGAVSGVKNPILLAEEIRRRGPHVLLVGEGAHRFGAQAGVAMVDPTAMIVPRQRARWVEEGQRRRGRGPEASHPDEHGTVGAVAVDREGHVAAATSTGGLLYKLPGRVGDTAVIGAGTYADDLAGACSCTGHGEAILKVALAKAATDLLRAGRPPQSAANEALAEFALRTHGEAGLILVDPSGALAVAFNTQRMSRATWTFGQPVPTAALERDP